jgi:hypothetical protein
VGAGDHFLAADAGHFQVHHGQGGFQLRDGLQAGRTIVEGLDVEPGFRQDLLAGQPHRAVVVNDHDRQRPFGGRRLLRIGGQSGIGCGSH